MLIDQGSKILLAVSGWIFIVGGAWGVVHCEIVWTRVSPEAFFFAIYGGFALTFLAALRRPALRSGGAPPDEQKPASEVAVRHAGS